MNYRWLGIAGGIATVLAVGFAGCTRKFYSYATGSLPMDAAALKVMHADKSFSFPPSFVPDPGKEGLKTIEGVDRDQDGLRDDLQRWAYALHSQTPEKLRELRRLIKAYQTLLDRDVDPDPNGEQVALTGRRIDCSVKVDFSPDIDRYIKAKTYNTSQRIRRSIESNKKFHMKTYRDVDVSAEECAKDWL